VLNLLEQLAIVDELTPYAFFEDKFFDDPDRQMRLTNSYISSKQNPRFVDRKFLDKPGGQKLGRLQRGICARESSLEVGQLAMIVPARNLRSFE
jgi:hypothetical protein